MCEKLTVHVRLIPYGNLRDAAKLHHYDQQRRDLDQERYVELRTATLNAIADTYPPLRHECERQKRIQNPEKEPE